MSQVGFAQIFSGDCLQVVTKYCDRIQRILNTYDIAIFMARKAICFYEAMIVNNAIEPTKCQVFSNRVLEYNNTMLFENKRIAVVDDVVVNGESLKRVAEELKSGGFCADYYVAACESNFAISFSEQKAILDESYSHYERSDIYRFSGQITQYIEASMIPFNIDHPIFEIETDISNLRMKLDELNAIEITSGLQRKYGIESRVIFLRLNNLEFDGLTDDCLESSIIKIRILFDSDRAIAIPFVLLPEIAYEQLDSLYSCVTTLQTERLCDIVDVRLRYESIHKLVSFLLSELLIHAFAKQFAVTFKKNAYSDIVHFGITTETLFGDLDDLVFRAGDASSSLQVVDHSFSNFTLTHFISEIYQIISLSDTEKIRYKDAKGNKAGFRLNNNDLMSQLVFSFEDFHKGISFELKSEGKLYISSIIDSFIDRGVLVPSIVHSEFGLVRAYKLGEYSKLTCEEIRSFAKMLFSYQENIDRDLEKTEFEKLCVLFFRSAITQKYFIEVVDFDEDCYGIGYSLYGPRISNNGKQYRVDSDSALISDFLHKEIVRKKYNSGNRVNYYLPTDCDISDKQLSDFCSLFAYDYSILEKIFSENPYKRDSNPWNSYVHTYNQYLTLAAIGEDYRNQILALCAELYQVTLLNVNIFSNTMSQIEKKEFNYILSGLNSGLWKFVCFDNDALEITTNTIKSKNLNAVRGLVGTRYRTDKNPALLDIRTKCGRLLFNIAFFLSESIKAKLGLVTFDINEDDSQLKISNDKRTMFSYGAYYRAFEDERHKIENEVNEKKQAPDFESWLQKKLKDYIHESKLLLDVCDLYLATNVPNFTIRKSILVLYSNLNEIPDKIDGINEVIFMGISSDHTCKFFPLQDKVKNESFLINVLQHTYAINSINYFIFDMTEEYEGGVQIENKMKGSYISEIIRKTIGRFKQTPTAPTKELVMINKSVSMPETFKRGDYKFNLNKTTDIDATCFEHIYYVLMEDEEMGEKKTNQNTFNFNGPVTGSVSGQVMRDVIVNVDTFDKEYFEMTIAQLSQLALTRPSDEKEIILNQVNELQTEVISKVPNKEKIKNIIEWIQKTTSIASFGITLWNILAPIIGAPPAL